MATGSAVSRPCLCGTPSTGGISVGVQKPQGYYSMSHIQGDWFASDQAALDPLHAAIDEEGIGAFLD